MYDISEDLLGVNGAKHAQWVRLHGGATCPEAHEDICRVQNIVYLMLDMCFHQSKNQVRFTH